MDVKWEQDQHGVYIAIVNDLRCEVEANPNGKWDWRVERNDNFGWSQQTIEVEVDSLEEAQQAAVENALTWPKKVL